jgi:hypothetical protein
MYFNIQKGFKALQMMLEPDKCLENTITIDFYFLFTIVMKVLISCTENSKFFIEDLDELELFIDKK